METRDLRICGFWDGDFTFHHVDYVGLPECGTTFRVRIDNDDPEQRHDENTRNPNQFLDHPHTIRAATKDEYLSWIRFLHAYYPTRPRAATEALRHLRLHGPSRVGPGRLRLALERLTKPILRFRDFRGARVCFVERTVHGYRLTDEGLWLTGLMK